MNQKSQHSETVNKEEAKTFLKGFQTDFMNLKDKDLGGIKHNIHTI